MKMNERQRALWEESKGILDRIPFFAVPFVAIITLLILVPFILYDAGRFVILFLLNLARRISGGRNE